MCRGDFSKFELALGFGKREILSPMSYDAILEERSF